jgi:hypothetical protein
MTVGSPRYATINQDTIVCPPVICGGVLPLPSEEVQRHWHEMREDPRTN